MLVSLKVIFRKIPQNSNKSPFKLAVSYRFLSTEYGKYGVSIFTFTVQMRQLYALDIQILTFYPYCVDAQGDQNIFTEFMFLKA